MGRIYAGGPLVTNRIGRGGWAGVGGGGVRLNAQLGRGGLLLARPWRLLGCGRLCAAAALGCGRQALPAAGGRSTRIPPSSSSSAGQTAAKENMVFAM